MIVRVVESHWTLVVRCQCVETKGGGPAGDEQGSQDLDEDISILNTNI